MATAETIDIGKRGTVADAIAHALIQYIADKGLNGGDRLPSERELVDMVGASRLPLREALSILKGLGVVEAKHGKGVFVKSLDLGALFGMLSPLLRVQADVDVPRIFEVRRHLEASIAQVAAASRTEASLLALGAQLDGMRAHYRDNKDAYIGHDMAFHQELARSTGNPIFHVFMASITDLLAEVHMMFHDDVAYRGEATREHAEILDAVWAQDGERARAAMLAHIRGAEARL
ncbi:FadR family transcriptional regulator [bacterium]|nr:FadR family transcriptional regulator [bacterium]